MFSSERSAPADGFGASAPLAAQTVSGQVSGTVFDSSGRQGPILPAAVATWSPKVKTPRVYGFTVGFQRSLPGNVSLPRDALGLAP